MDSGSSYSPVFELVAGFRIAQVLLADRALVQEWECHIQLELGNFDLDWVGTCLLKLLADSNQTRPAADKAFACEELVDWV